MPLRFFRPGPIGLALSGGAARGIAHIGVLRAVEERGIEVSCVAGTSAGALAGCLWAGGMSALAMEKWVSALNWRTAIRPRISRRGIATIGPLESMLLETIGTTGFEDLKIPLAVTATSILSGQGVVFTSGPLEPALRASCSVPGVFTPVAHNGDLLVDGGLIANIPIFAARSMGARRVIAIDLGTPYGPSGDEPSDMMEIIMTSLAIIQRRMEKAQLEDADLVISPDLSGFGLARIDRIDERIEAGYRAAREALERWR